MSEWKLTATVDSSVPSNDLLFWWQEKEALIAQRVFVSGHSVFGNIGQITQKNCVVNITGTAVTYVSGDAFDPFTFGLSDCWVGSFKNKNFIAQYVDATHLTLRDAVASPMTNVTLTVLTKDDYGSDGGQDQSVVTILDYATQSLTYNIAMSFTSIWVPNAAAVNSQHTGSATLASDGITLTRTSGAPFLKRWQNQPVIVGGTLHTLFKYIYSADKAVLSDPGTPGTVSYALDRLHACAGYDQLVITGGAYPIFGSTGFSVNMRTTDTQGTGGSLDTQVGISINPPSRGTLFRPRLNYGLFIADQTGLLEGSVFYGGAAPDCGTQGDWAILTNRGLIYFGDDVTIQKTSRPFDTSGSILNSSINVLSAHGGAYANFSGPAGTTRGFGYQTFTPTTPGATPDLNSESGSSHFRWFLGAANGAETGTDGVGSDFFLQRYHDDGSGWDVPWFIRRTDGVNVLTGLTVIQQAAALQVSMLSGSASANVLLGGTGTQSLTFAVLSSGSYYARWALTGSASAFTLTRHDSAGALIDTPITIDASTGDVTIAGLTLGATGGSLTLTGALSAASMALTGNASIGGSAAITGSATIGGNLGVTGNFSAANMYDSTTVDAHIAASAGGVSTLLGSICSSSGVLSATSMTLTGSALIGGNLGVTGTLSASNIYDKTTVDANIAASRYDDTAVLAAISSLTASVGSLFTAVSGCATHGTYPVSGGSVSI